MHLVDIGLWCLILAGSLGSNFIAMLIHARLETYFTTILPLIARPHIRQHIVHGVPNVRQTVDIRNSSSDIGVLFSHDIYYITPLAKMCPNSPHRLHERKGISSILATSRSLLDCAPGINKLPAALQHNSSK